MKLLIVGTLSNPTIRLKHDLDSIISSLGEECEIEVYLVESDSKMSSYRFLDEQLRSRKNIILCKMGNLKKNIPDRVERIRYCRNKYVSYIRENYSEKAWEYIVVADLDGMNSKLTKVGIGSSFKLLKKFDAVFANQKFGYYDLYALREEKWMPKDPFIEFYERVSEIRRTNKFKYFQSSRMRRVVFREKTKLIYEKMIKINENDHPIEVDSAFGGLGIYNPRVFLESDYDIVDKSVCQSEHVDLHFKARQLGFKFVINPKMINSHYNTHNINRVRAVRILRANKIFLASKLSASGSAKTK